ncbi:helix-turn-helix transcriptional regulator [Litorisediminicola beolgyonensis]|uniref:Helix-turn-helix transcriptional regulator n=1 Tax=Litorisediminicola beolgyonensis TaxID=1173614 RepID=A0ABW3ZLL0_9RHOB
MPLIGSGQPPREMVDAEHYVPELLQGFLLALEGTRRSSDVWDLLVRLGRQVGLPFVDFVVTASLQDWKKTLFIRTSYEADWLQALHSDPELGRWTYFRDHAMRYLTPVLVGLEFVDEYRQVPPERVEHLREAARRGLRAGFSVPLRQHAPPQAGLITFSGDISARQMRVIARSHGWVLHTAALTGHQRYMQHFTSEFPERNHLTAKQIELLTMIGRGLKDREIAEALGVSVSAVRQRLGTLHTNTGVPSRTELAALAMTVGLLPMPTEPGHDSADTRVLIESDGGPFAEH